MKVNNFQLNITICCIKIKFNRFYISNKSYLVFFKSSKIRNWNMLIIIAGNTLGIPDTVMGLTFVAAGVSVPDALSSLSVVKEGKTKILFII